MKGKETLRKNNSSVTNISINNDSDYIAEIMEY